MYKYAPFSQGKEKDKTVYCVHLNAYETALDEHDFKLKKSTIET